MDVIKAKRSSTKKVISRLLCYVVALIFTAFLVNRYGIELPDEIGIEDFRQYWTSANFWLAGLNPYDEALHRDYQLSMWRYLGEPVLMWNPPIVLPLVFIYTLFPAPQAALLWFLTSIIIFVYAIASTSILKIIRDSNSKSIEKVALILGVALYYPLISNLELGQISAVLLLGLTGALQLIKTGEKKFLSGCVLSLTLIKPHLLFLLYLHLLLWSVHTKEWKYILGLLCGTLALLFIATLASPNVLGWYISASQNPPIYFKTPTVGSWLQEMTQLHSVYIRFLPSILVAFGYLLRGTWKRSCALPASLIAPSLLFSPYGWGFDQLLLIPFMGQLLLDSGRVKRKVVIYSLLLTQFLCFLVPIDGGQHYLVWVPIFWILAERIFSRRKKYDY